MKKLLSKKLDKGITLIALVITIVVLIILAGVIISITLGNGGIIDRAKTAKQEYANAEGYEQTEIDKMSDEISSLVGGHREVTDEEIENKIKNVLDNYYQKLRSDTYENVTFTSGASYTAPCDGYYCCAADNTNKSGMWLCYVSHYTKDGTLISYECGPSYNYGDDGCEIYMKKGEYITFYNQASTITSSKFFYAVGCQPDATE